MFSFESHCEGLAGSQKQTFQSVVTPKDLWDAVSEPWSQVREPRRFSGSAVMALTRPSRTNSAPSSVGRCTSTAYRVVRSTRVPIADLIVLA